MFGYAEETHQAEAKVNLADLSDSSESDSESMDSDSDSRSSDNSSVEERYASSSSVSSCCYVLCL